MPSPDGYSGIGAKCEVVTNDTNQIIHFKISKVFVDGLAGKSGLEVGDIIYLKKPISDLYLMEVATRIRNLDFNDIDKIIDVNNPDNNKLNLLSNTVKDEYNQKQKRDFFVKENVSYKKYNFEAIKEKFTESRSH